MGHTAPHHTPHTTHQHQQQHHNQHHTTPHHTTPHHTTPHHTTPHHTHTNLYHYIKHFYQGGLYIFWWPHCPQTYITTYNTSITTYNTPIRGLCIFPGGHTAHKLISLHTTLLSLHKTPLSMGSLYFLVATLPTNLYHYIQHLYQGGLYIFWRPHCPQTYITTYN